MVILDTCTLIWLASNQDKLSAKAKSTIRHQSDALFVSAISAFEIGLKEKKGLIELALPVKKWFTDTLEFHGIHEISVTSDILIEAVQLPKIHNDPCDRIIVATAIMNNLKVVSPDTHIASYKRNLAVW